MGREAASRPDPAQVELGSKREGDIVERDEHRSSKTLSRDRGRAQGKAYVEKTIGVAITHNA